MLYGQVISIREGVIAQNLCLSWNTNTGKSRRADALIRKAGKLLRTRGDANDGIPVHPESAGRVAGDVAIPTDAGEADPRFIHHKGRYGMYPSGAPQVVRIRILVGKGDGEHSDASVKRPAFRVESGDLIRGPRIGLYFYIALVILHE